MKRTAVEKHQSKLMAFPSHQQQAVNLRSLTTFVPRVGSVFKCIKLAELQFSRCKYGSIFM
jgi:hypothetical protein